MFNLGSLYKLSKGMKLYFAFSAIIYPILSFYIFYTSHPVFLNTTQVSSALDMLNTMVLSESTIIAIVITLSLLAVQLTASSYSTHVIDIFKENPSLWIVIGVYIFAITYGLGIIKFIDKINPSGVSNLENHIWIAYFLAIFALGALIPYIIDMLNLMKPATVINRFAEKITKENILLGVGDSSEKYDEISSSYSYSFIDIDRIKPVVDIEKDPIQPVIDIIHSSMLKYDYGTFRYGLKALEDSITLMLKDEEFKEDEAKVSRHVFNHLERMGKLAAKRELRDSLIGILNTLLVIGKVSVSYELEDTTSEVANTIKTICKRSIEKEIDNIGIISADFLEEIGKKAIEHDLSFAATVIANSLGIIGKTSLKQKPDETIWIIGSLNQLGKTALSEESEHPLSHTVTAIGEIGEEAVKNEVSTIVLKSIDYLTEMGIVSVNKDLEDVANRAIKYLREIGIKTAKNEFNTKKICAILDNVKNAIIKIKETAEEKEFKDTVTLAESSIKRVQKIEIKQNLEEECKKFQKDGKLEK